MVKFFAAIIIAVSIALAQGSAVWNGTADISWYNSEQSEFIITTAEQLAGLAELSKGESAFYGKRFTLGNDIVLNDTTNWANWANVATGLNQWTPIGSGGWFQGYFDGAGHIISGVYISGSYLHYQALFGSIDSNATIKNLGVVKSFIKGLNSLGGLVGYNEGTIENCYSTGSVQGDRRVGGLVGDNWGMIINSYSTVSVQGYDWIGGLAGVNLGTIINCYSTGNVKGTSDLGGLTAYSDIVEYNGYTSNGEIINSYYDSQTSGQDDDDGRGEPRTTAQMKTQSTFINWDFTDIWGINSEINGGYPYLRIFGGNNTSIRNARRSDNRYGIRFASNIVSQKAEISVVLPNNERVAEMKIVIYDKIGNVVYEGSEITWNLTNKTGRKVANGTYLVIVEVKGENGRSYMYSAKLGVSR